MGQLQRVLLVEDNETDEALAVRSIRRSGLNISVDVARDGEEACDFLSGGPYQLVLLDIKLPKLSGLEILDRMRRSSATRYVPVIMLTSSGEKRDIEAAFDLGANSYIQKQIDPEISDANLKIALFYWLCVHTAAAASFSSRQLIAV